MMTGNLAPFLHTIYYIFHLRLIMRKEVLIEERHKNHGKSCFSFFTGKKRRPVPKDQVGQIFQT
jgi:hypothetical protein